MHYTMAARNYITLAWEAMKQHGDPPNLVIDKTDALDLYIEIYRYKIINKGWPKSKTKFARWDVFNYTKLLIDVVAKFHEIDDDQIMDGRLAKKLAREDRGEKEGVQIWLRKLSDDEKPWEVPEICPWQI